MISCFHLLNIHTYLGSFFQHVLKHRFRNWERHVEKFVLQPMLGVKRTLGNNSRLRTGIPSNVKNSFVLEWRGGGGGGKEGVVGECGSRGSRSLWLKLEKM